MIADPKPLNTVLYGEEANPIDPDLGFDIKAIEETLRVKGKLPKLPTRRSKRVFDETLK